MSLKPWREIAQPHKDVLQGTLKQSEFAADISRVALGQAEPEYQDGAKFFARTFITEGMRLLLISVAQRLCGMGGDPVIQLQTAFGGGKTHTMLAVYHLAARRVPTAQLEGIPPLLDAAQISDLPTARVAVLDGIRLSPSQPQHHPDGTIANTLWGELAWQLLGSTGYAQVADSDRDATSPGKEVLIQLLQQAAPCVILMDETVAFFRQLDEGKTLKAGSLDTNLSFIQALTEALKAVPNAILLGSLPESDLEIGGAMGQRALNSLEKYFARVESVWKPVGSDEAFEIVRRRLFDSPGSRAEIEGISRQFSDFYRAHSSKFPLETQSNAYFERLCQSYPIHPEIFDRLYEDWSTLDKFQRTRGVLQYMAVVIHRLWNDNNQDALILPGSIPLDDPTVRNKSIHYLPQGWEPILEKEIDGPKSSPAEMDGHDTRFGSVQAARRTTRTLFLGSAPSVSSQGIKGVQQERILLGAVQPGQAIGTFEDVLKRLRDKLHYLYAEGDRLWFDTRPNLRREMESRRANIHEQQQLLPELRERVGRLFAKNHCFSGIHLFTPSADIPDDYGSGPRLVVLSSNSPYNRSSHNRAEEAAAEIVRHRGDKPRQKQNRLIFLAAEQEVIGRLYEAGRTFLAWQSIVNEVKEGKLDLTISLSNQAKDHAHTAEKSLQQLLREAWKWLFVPIEAVVRGQQQLNWEAVTLSPSAPHLIQEIETRLREEEWLIFEWSPIHLRTLLHRWYFKNGVSDISLLKVYQDCAHYLYLPRLLNDSVFQRAVQQGCQSRDYFGYASAREDERYLGFCFGSVGAVILDDRCLLIEREAAAAYQQRLSADAAVIATPAVAPPLTSGTPTGGLNLTPPVTPPLKPTPAPQKPPAHRFYATITLNPVSAKMNFAQIVDEVIQNFTTRLGVEVTLSLEVNAQSREGFDEALQRTIQENCSVLKFESAEFEL